MCQLVNWLHGHKDDKKYCAKCKPIEDYKHMMLANYIRYHSSPEYVEENKLRTFVQRHADELQIGDIV